MITMTDRVRRLTPGRIPPSSLPSILTSLGLRSVMVEGGSRVLSSFLHTLKRDDGSKLVDSVVVTVAPTFIGQGVGVVPEAGSQLYNPLCNLSNLFVLGRRQGPSRAPNCTHGDDGQGHCHGLYSRRRIVLP